LTPKPKRSRKQEKRLQPADVAVQLSVELPAWEDVQGLGWTATAWTDGMTEPPKDPPCTLTWRTIRQPWTGDDDPEVFEFFDYSGEGSKTYNRVLDAVKEGSLEFDALGLVYIDHLETAPSERGRGLGTLLMVRVLDFLADHGMVTHGFMTAAPPRPEDQAASPGDRLPRFYEKLGWRRIGKTNSLIYDFEAQHARPGLKQ
jgi:GNAT superfamily N-acetyltransferase